MLNSVDKVLNQTLIINLSAAFGCRSAVVQHIHLTYLVFLFH